MPSKNKKLVVSGPSFDFYLFGFLFKLGLSLLTEWQLRLDLPFFKKGEKCDTKSDVLSSP